MKKLLFAFCLILGSVLAVNAQDSTATNQGAGSTEMASDDYSDKDVITADELPAMIKDQLASADYASWTQDKIYKKEKDGKTFYAVELKNGDQTKVVKFDAQGNKVKEKMKDK